MQGGSQRRRLLGGGSDAMLPELGCPGAHNLTMLPAQPSPATLFNFLLDLQDCFAGKV